MIDPATVAGITAIGGVLAANQKLAIKIWQSVIDDALGGLLAPYQYRRIERAKLDIEYEKFELQRQIDACKDAKKNVVDYDDTRHGTHVAGVIASPAMTTEIVSQAKTFNLRRELAKQEALFKTLLKALEEAEKLDTNADVSDDPPDPDWKWRWINYAQDARHDHMQTLWAKVLAGEYKKPGSYSLRTLNALHHMTKNEAELISKAAPFVIDGHIYGDADEVLAEQGLSFQNLLQLTDLGIVHSASGLGIGYTILKEPPWTMCCNEVALIISPKKDQKHFEMKKGPLSASFLPITSVGLEILSLGSFKANKSYLKIIASDIKKHEYDVKVAPIVIVDGKAKIRVSEAEPL